MTLGADVLQCVNQYLYQHNIQFQLSATDRVACFYRVQINGQIFYSARYGRVVKCSSFTVFFDGSEHGPIQYLLYISKHCCICSCQATAVLIFNTGPICSSNYCTDFEWDYCSYCNINIMHCVPLSAIQQKCLCMQLPGHSVNFVLG